MSKPHAIRILCRNYGLLIGAMWVGEIIVGNLGGTAILGNIRDSHPAIYAMAPRFALAAVIITGVAGLVAAYRTGSIQVALRVGVWSGLISGAIACVVVILVTILFHKAMMSDASNIHEFSLTAHRAPSQAELSSFLYRDALGGGLNHLWIGPLLGVIVGGFGAILGRSARRADANLPNPTLIS